MVLGVKYCGGCNTHYDRTALVKRIQDDFPSIQIEYGDSSTDGIDLLLLVCGCPVRCIAEEAAEGSFEKWIISSQAEYPLLFQRLLSLLDSTGENHER
ncbi:hypothetical protein AGMMS49587_13310 [Spirochaetia bacterium]|nr:hypothetical protein AGMMS49587_13310 [Spirochaetia bacterium]